MTEEKVFIVDDHDSVRKSLARLVRSNGLNVQTFAGAQEYLDAPPYDGPSCLVLDVRMPDLDGLELQKLLARRKPPVAIIFITGHGDVPMSVQAMKEGAVDFLQKPLDEADLLKTIRRALEKNRRERNRQKEFDRVRARYDTLTPREREVFALVISGLLNKQVAWELGASEKTIKVHRARVMRKMKADSLPDLVRFAEILGVSVTDFVP